MKISPTQGGLIAIKNEWSIGVDLVDAKGRKVDGALASRILSKNELARYHDLNEKAARDFLIGRWAAKEAVFKATGTKVKPSAIDIANDEEGGPTVGGIAGYDVVVSISHDKGLAIAFAMAKRSKKSRSNSSAASKKRGG